MSFMDDTTNYIRKYLKRNILESGFSSEKKTTVDLKYQNNKDSEEMHGFCNMSIHNLMLLHG